MTKAEMDHGPHVRKRSVIIGQLYRTLEIPEGRVVLLGVVTRQRKVVEQLW